jgi:hypothetical protein
MDANIELESRIENLKLRLQESNTKIADPASATQSDMEENRELKSSLAKLQSQATSENVSLKPKSYTDLMSSITEPSSASASNAPVPTTPRLPAPSAAALLTQGEDLLDIENMSEEQKLPQSQLDVLQAPDVGAKVLPSQRPGVDYAAQQMINALQKQLAPPSILARLEETGKPVNVAKQKPRQRITIRFPVQRQIDPSLGEGSDEPSYQPPPVTVIDKRSDNLVDRKSILENLRGALPIIIAKPGEISKEKQPTKSVKLQQPIKEVSFAEPSSTLRQIIIIKKMPKHIFLTEDTSLLLDTLSDKQADKQVEEVSAELTKSATEALQKTSRSRVTAKPEFGLMSHDITDMEILGSVVRERLPQKKHVGVMASGYYMNNRQKFINFINQLFMPYYDELSGKQDQISCDPAVNSEFSLLTHQKIVTDYLNIHTPYRGLLLYHGLGSGKTCSSIAIAEGLKTHKNIIVLTPASLRRNYIEELKKCGDEIYKKNQFWEFVSITSPLDPMINTLSAILSLPKDFIKSAKGAWLVNVKKPSNYTSLNRDQLSSLEAQLNKMIETKYTFYNYNGMRMSTLKAMPVDSNNNPFSDHVVIIDEAHNFISRIVNKLKRPSSLSMQMYDLLMNAQNVKIILLSGTPIINYPNEVAVIFNILRGYIKTWKFPLQVSTKAGSKIDKKSLSKLFETVNSLDYMDYDDSSHILTVTRNPFGFVNMNERGEYNGVIRIESESESSHISDTDFERLIISTLRGKDITIQPASITVQTYKALPDSLDEFRSYFIDSSTGNLKNVNMFIRRILGLASYFRSAQEQLMPRYDKSVNFRVITIPMSDHQFAEYETARKAERKLEKKSKSKKRSVAPKPGTGGGDDIYEDAVSSYRIFSRLFCNFVFPTEIQRPRPKDSDDVEGAIRDGVTEEDIDALTVSERVQNLNGEHTGDDTEELQKDISAKVDGSYEKRIAIAIQKIEQNKMRYLRRPADGGELQIYSPKFLAMLENIQDPHHTGLHLVYSQFRSLEGIRLFSLVLDANGYARFRIMKNDAGNWVWDLKDEDKGKRMYALYTGTETDEEREIIRNIFNSTWDYIPVTIKQQLVPKSSNNFMGEIIKVLMITASGAEGINLRNVRWVHITEPYWQPVRIEQVIGRARRICSHNDLPEENRTVNVMIYVMGFTPDQLAQDASLELKLNDVSKKNSDLAITTDQALFEISTIKEEINQQLLMAIKQASIDCSIHRDIASKEKLQCFSFGNVTSNNFSYNPSISAEESDTAVARNTEVKQLKLTSITMTVEGEKKKFAFDKESGIVYDWNSYELAREMGGDPLVVGKLIQGADGKQKFVKGSSSLLRETGGVAMAAPKSVPTAAASAAASAAPLAPSLASSTKKSDKGAEKSKEASTAKTSSSSKTLSSAKGASGDS